MHRSSDPISTIVVTEQREIPIYLQLKQQIAFLIYTRELSEGDRLPSVRAFAERLGINLATVAQAYKELQREGLIESKRGRGTFVLPSPVPELESDLARQDRLSAVLREAIQRARNLGFQAAAIQQRLSVLLTQSEHKVQTAFVGYNLDIATKYATFLEHSLGRDAVSVRPLSLKDLDAGDPGSAEALGPVFFVITLVSIVQEVEALIQTRYPEKRVLVVNIEATDETKRSLARLSPNGDACLVAQKHFLHRALNAIQALSPLDGPSLPYAFDFQPKRITQLATRANTVIHTFGVTGLLDHLGVPKGKRLELVYQADSESLEKLKRAFSL